LVSGSRSPGFAAFSNNAPGSYDNTASAQSIGVERYMQCIPSLIVLNEQPASINAARIPIARFRMFSSPARCEPRLNQGSGARNYFASIGSRSRPLYKDVPERGEKAGVERLLEPSGGK
jgi:hypothetical protein